MKCLSNAKGIVFALFFFCAAAAFPQNSSPLANRRTALRCLEESVSYFSEENWEAADSQARLGIAYDSSVPDLWYMRAACENAMGSSRAAVIRLLETALGSDSWVSYSRDSARLLYADMLSETGRPQEAVAALDSSPMLYSPESEYIRIKSYYRMKDGDSVAKARNKVDGARRMYPSDMRFPLVFFKNEDPSSSDPLVKKLSSYFIAQISQFADAAPDKNEELEMYAALFAEGETKIHLLKSFHARGLRHPLYACEALKTQLLSGREAFDYFASFADKEIDFGILTEFISLLSDDETVSYARSYFAAFSGTVAQDTDGDGNENLFAVYYRGRPQKLYFDGNQDGETDWSIQCDFGVPVSGVLGPLEMSFSWGQFPFLSYIEFASAEDGKESSEKFNFVAEALKWSPVSIVRENTVSQKLDLDFFYPVLHEESLAITKELLLNSASSFEISNSGIENGTVHFILLDGSVFQALYYSADGRLFAQARFENNIPVVRVVDSDRDGIFETTEFYDVDSEGTMNTHSLEEERIILQSLYGVPSDGSELYLRMVQVDRNNDTVSDFTEEYLENRGKISSWDTDGDGKWNIRHVIYPGGQSEESLFFTYPKKSLVMVKSEGGIPYSVTVAGRENETLSVIKDEETDFYWLSDSQSAFQPGRYPGLAKRAKQLLERQNLQGFSMVLEDERSDVLCVRVGTLDFGIAVDAHNGTEDE